MEEPNTIEATFVVKGATVTYLGKELREVPGRKRRATLYRFETTIQDPDKPKLSVGYDIQGSFSKEWVYRELLFLAIAKAKRIAVDEAKESDKLAQELAGLLRDTIKYWYKEDEEEATQIFLEPSDVKEKKGRDNFLRIQEEARKAAKAFESGLYFFEPNPWKGLEKRVPAFRMGAHLVDLISKRQYGKKSQRSLFDRLPRDTQNAIIQAEAKQETIVEGIDLSASETKLVIALAKLLDGKSQTKDPKSKDYYTGNMDAIIKHEGGADITKPGLLVTLYELAKEYGGTDTPSGKEMQNVFGIVEGLSNRKFLARYRKTVPTLKKGKEGELVEEIKLYHSLLDLGEASLTYKENGEVKDRAAELVIYLHDAYRRHILEKYIYLPDDIFPRLQESYGSKKYPHTYLDLVLELTRHLSGNNGNTYPWKKENALYALAGKEMERRQRKRAEKYLSDSIDAAKKLGLVKECREERAKTDGGVLLVFELNPDWKE